MKYLFVQKDHPARPLGDITQGNILGLPEDFLINFSGHTETPPSIAHGRVGPGD